MQVHIRRAFACRGLYCYIQFPVGLSRNKRRPTTSNREPQFQFRALYTVAGTAYGVYDGPEIATGLLDVNSILGEHFGMSSRRSRQCLK